MIIFKKAGTLSSYLENQRKKSRGIGFVPTLGALHEGHISLLQEAARHDALKVCSIFVNPTQFNDPKDYEKYPVTIDQDIYKLEKNGCDILFLPAVSEIYPSGTRQQKHYELGYLETILEGEHRPGHFQGVCMVMERLLSIVRPDNLYMGQKDFQQCMVIARLIAEMNMKDKIHLNICPVLRESDGLAMSSRNMRLNPEERAQATALHETLMFLKTNIDKGSLADIKKQAADKLSEKGFKVDYVEIADQTTLKSLNEWDARKDAVGLVAAHLHEVRLIDNMLLTKE
jgi:pantoate--beta-alanine ligase